MHNAFNGLVLLAALSMNTVVFGQGVDGDTVNVASRMASTEGRIQVMHIGFSSVVRANQAGADLVVIASLSNVIRGTLFGSPGLADLKGGIFGISSTGSESDAVATIALSRLGLTRTDVTIKEVGWLRTARPKSAGVAFAFCIFLSS